MTALEVPRLNIRPARVGDVPGIYDLIRIFAERKLMIRRSMGELYESIREFLVAVDDEGRVVGCVALHVFWEDLAELRCLAVAEHLQGQGWAAGWWTPAGSRPRPRDRVGLHPDHAVGFFERCGYHRSKSPSCRTRSGTNACAARCSRTARRSR